MPLELGDLRRDALLELRVPFRRARRPGCRTSSCSALMRRSERTRAKSSAWLIGFAEKVVGAGFDALDALRTAGRAR